MEHDMIKQLARLSKLKFTSSELDKITEDLTDIITMLDTVNTFNSSFSQWHSSAVSCSGLRDDKAVTYNGRVLDGEVCVKAVVQKGEPL